MAPSRAFVVFLSLFYSTEAFLPSALLGLSKEDGLRTRDHAIITKIGLLQSMVAFLKANPQYIDVDVSASIGDFAEILISADNPNEVEKFLSLITSKMRLQNAIAEIQSSNAEVSSAPLKNVAAAHFSGEQFRKGSRRLQELKSSIVTTLLKGIKFEHARQLAGQYLHTLQDFYSHSNWVELGNRVKAYDSLANGGISIPSELIAKPNETTCITCPLTTGKNYNCDNNLITRKITSGYHGGHDISKPANAMKCIHGGLSDSIGVEGTRGGINKDSTARQWSPHYKLHAVAAELAIEATKTFFEDLRAAVGDDIFARFLNVQAVRTLALVLDDTGSMTNEIKSVRKLSTEFVQKSNNSAINTAFVYILVPFNDPEVGPVTVSSNPDEVIQAVNALKAHDGGDCPELGMTGLYQALLKSVQDSIIYYFSDADAKDSNLAAVVLILAKQKRVKLNFILSGKCSYKRKRRSVRLSRDIRQLGSQDLYQNLAAATGGQILRTKKSEVSVIVDIIGSQTSAEDADDLMEVILLNVNSDVKEVVRDIPFLIQVDNTLRNILIVLAADGNPRITLFNPSENMPLTVKMMRDFDRIQVTEMGRFEGGPLEIRVRCTGPYSLQVTGRSILDFTYRLSLVDNTGTGETRPLLGSPVKGQTLLLGMTFTTPELVGEVTSLSLINTTGTDLELFAVKRGEGIYAGSYYVLFTPSVHRFRFQVNAKTTEGKLLRRIKPTEIKMETVELGFSHQLENNYTRIFPNFTRKIPLKIRNTGTSQTFTLKATDDLGYVTSLVPDHAFVAENETVQFALELQAPSHASPGDTSTIAVYATPTSSHQPSNYMVFYVSVMAKETDQFPPSCEVVNQTKKCDAVYNNPNCSDVTWTSDISVLEMGQGLLTITTKNSKFGQLTVAPFTKGLSNKSFTGVYSSTCCHPSANIIAFDLFGNSGSCELSAVTPIINIEAVTKSAELNLELGQTSKLGFSIRNLGTKGSFTLQASENTHFTVYVSPLNVILDHKQVARSELVLTGMKETGFNRTSFVVNAIPLTNAANVPHVQLLEIIITVGKRKKQVPLLRWNVTTDVNPKPQLIHYGEKAQVQFTLINNGHAGAFDLKTSPSRNVLAEFTSNPVHLNSSEKISLELTMEAVRNRDLEETILISTVPRASGQNITLFTQHVTIIHTAEKDKLPTLKGLVQSDKVTMTAGSTVTVNFTVMNVGQGGQCSFKVLCPGSLICHVTPESSFRVKENTTILGQLTVKSSADLEPGKTEVKVMGIVSGTSNTETSIFTLEVVLTKTGIVEDEIHEKEQKTGMIKIIGFVLGCMLLLILTLLVVCLCMKKRGSWTVWKKESQKPQKTVDKPEMV